MTVSVRVGSDVTIVEIDWFSFEDDTETEVEVSSGTTAVDKAPHPKLKIIIKRIYR